MKNIRALTFGLAVSIVLSGCSSLKLEDVAGPTTAATVTAGAAVLTVHPAAAIVAGAAAGAAVEAAIPEEESVDITQIETPEQAAVAKTQLYTDLFLDVWKWIVGAIGALIVIAWLIPGPQTFFRRKDHAQSSDTNQQPARSRRYQRHPRS